VAQAGSLSGAAQQLNVNTTTVLRRVGSLEDDLGARLFERERTGYRLTPAGDRLVEALEPVERRLGSLPRDFAAAGSGTEGIVRIEVSEILAICVLAPELPALQKSHPELEVELITDARWSNASAAPRVGSPLRDVDVALRAARPTQGDMLMRKVGDMAFGLYGAPRYFEAHGRPQEGADPLSGHQIIGYPRGATPLGPVWWLSRAEKSAHVALRSAGVLASAEAASLGIGLAPLPCIVGDADQRLERVFGPDKLGTMELWLMARNDLAQMAHVRVAMEFLVEAVRRHKGRLEGRAREVTELLVKPLINPAPLVKPLKNR
jgi:DNA-binding transcriptional LysR family regulator